MRFNDNMNSDRNINRLTRNNHTSVLHTFLYLGGGGGCPGRVQLSKNNTVKLCCLAFGVKLGKEMVSTSCVDHAVSLSRLRASVLLEKHTPKCLLQSRLVWALKLGPYLVSCLGTLNPKT